MPPPRPPLRVRLLGALVLGGVLAAALPARAATPNPELDRMLAKLPDPAKWKQSPLQDALDPATHDPDLARAVAAIKKKNLPAALGIMRGVAARYPKHATIQGAYGELCLLAKDYSEAERAFRAVAADPRTAAVGWYYTGVAQLLGHRLPAAAGSMHRCLDAKPEPSLAAGAWTVLALQSRLSGKDAEAIHASQQVTRLAPRNREAWAVRGYCDAGGKHYADALADFRRVIALDRGSAVGYEGLGDVYLETNRPGDAIAPLRTALTLAPKNYPVATKLGYCCLRAGQPAEGVRACKQALAARPGFSKAWDVLGMCYQRLGKGRDAVGAFEQAVKAEPGNTAARTHLEEARKAGGNARV